GHDERGVVRLETGAMVIHKIIARESLDRIGCAGAGERLGVWVAVAVEQHWQDARGERLRDALLEEDAPGRLLPPALGLLPPGRPSRRRCARESAAACARLPPAGTKG